MSVSESIQKKEKRSIRNQKENKEVSQDKQVIFSGIFGVKETDETTYCLWCEVLERGKCYGIAPVKTGRERVQIFLLFI